MSNEQTEWIVDADAFAALREEWNTLPRPLSSPFLGHDWLRLWHEAFGADLEPAICVLRRDGRLVGAIALGRSGRLLRSLANRHTQVFSAVGSEETWDPLARAVVAAAGDELELWGIPEDDPFLVTLERAARRAGRLSFREPLLTSPVVDTEGDLEAYRRNLGGTSRRTLARYTHKLERELAARIALAVRPADATILEQCFSLEAAGWKGRDGTAILSRHDTATFFRSLMLTFYERGILAVSSIEVDGALIAFELGVVEGNRLWSLKTSYDESFASYSPGRVLRYATVERCFELGLDGNEMLGSAEAYKLSLATRSRSNCIFRSYRRAPVPIARYAYRYRVRPALKRVYVHRGGLATRMAAQRTLVRLRR